MARLEKGEKVLKSYLPPICPGQHFVTTKWGLELTKFPPISLSPNSSRCPLLQALYDLQQAIARVDENVRLR